MIKISYLTLFLATLMIIQGFWWLLYPYNPITFKDTPHEVITKTVKRGEHVAFYFDYCKNINMSGDLTISFVDGFIYNTSTVKSNIVPGCHKVVYQVYVPKAIPLGTYKISAALNYKVNPIREIDIVTETEYFIVE